MLRVDAVVRLGVLDQRVGPVGRQGLLDVDARGETHLVQPRNQRQFAADGRTGERWQAIHVAASGRKRTRMRLLS